MTTPVYLAGRQNVEAAGPEDGNAKLAAIADAFGLGWLEKVGGDNPLQRLWQRDDELATVELLNFGDAVQHLTAADAAWVKHQVQQIKAKDQGNRDGAIFELLGLNLFARAGADVLPAPHAQPGFDGTVVLEDGARMLVSIKNHRISTHEQRFLDAAKQLDQKFRQRLDTAGIHDASLFAALGRYPGDTDWLKLDADIRALVADFQQQGAANKETEVGRMALSPLDPSYHPLSRSAFSSACVIVSPHHRNEQDKFINNLRKGCANLETQTVAETSADVCRVLLVRLWVTASIEQCANWARSYFTENPDAGVALILLYQAAVVATPDGRYHLTHYLRQIAGPNFKPWRQRSDGSRRELPDLSVLVGTIAQAPPALMLVNGMEGVSLADRYAYQRADINRTHDPAQSSGRMDIGHPAPGVSVQLVLESAHMAPMVIAKRGDRGAKLLLLP